MDNTSPEIKLTNTRTRQKEVFRPIDASNVRMYVCGPTVYDRAHIGNARPVVVFDVLYRLLRHVYGAEQVTYVRNFTDVDDRIIERAVATKSASETLEDATRRITDETIGWYHQDMDALGALRPDNEPRCTEYIPPMVKMSEELIAKGFAYAAEGHVLFSVEAFEQYGALSGRSVDDMIAGARVEVAPYKKNPMDFVIWKPSTDEQPGWDSPWGRGRPGWHIECSAMARELLGEVFDIHAGGIDLQFPHHENELAQSCCAHDTDVMANYWLHNEMLRVEGEKMSKSLGNFFTVRDLLDQGIPGEVIRFVLLSTHYRQPLDWTGRRVEEARKRLVRWYRKTDGVDAEDRMSARVEAALTDDLNTHLVFSEMDQMSAPALKATLRVMGFPDAESVDWWRADQEILVGVSSDPGGGLTEAQTLLDDLLRKWQHLRDAKDYQAADALKAALGGLGVEVRASADGPQAAFTARTDLDPAKLEALK
ncbi:MAG: cysteine--tRNA ligase [Pseudomonadota bacterium]